MIKNFLLPFKLNLILVISLFFTLNSCEYLFYRTSKVTCDETYSVPQEINIAISNRIHFEPSEQDILYVRNIIDSLKALPLCLSNEQDILNLIDLEFKISKYYPNKAIVIDLLNNLIERVLVEHEINASLSPLLFKLYIFRADAFYSSGYIEKSFDDIFSAKNYYEAVKDDCGTGYFHYRLGMIYYAQAFFENAKIEFQKANKILENICDNSFSVISRNQEVLSNVGLCFERLNELDSAEYYFSKSVQYIKSIDLNKSDNFKISFLNAALFHAKANKANILYLKEDITKSLAILDSISDISSYDIISDPVILSGYYLLKLQILLAQKNFETFDEIIAEFETHRSVFIKNKNLFAKYLEIIRDAHFERGMYQAAHHSSLELQQVLKEIHKNQLDLIKNNFSLHNEIYQNRIQLELDQANLAQKVRQNQVLSWLFILIVVLFSMLLVLTISYRSKRKALAVLNEEIARKNKSLVTTNRKLDQLVEQKNKVLRITAHDLRNPISAIYGLADFITTSENKEELEQIRSMIEQSSLNALKIIDEIMSVAKAERIIQDIAIGEKETINLNDFVRKGVAALQFRAERKQQELIFIPANETLHITINPTLMMRAFNNLVENAIKFSPNQSTIYIETEHKVDKICLKIRDEGIGIPEEMIPSLFEYNDRLKQRKGTAGEESFGFGLFAVKSIIDAHNGTISVKSEENKGSEFTICIPFEMHPD